MVRGTRAAVFLDRDGVLNATTMRQGVPHPPRSPDELVILPGVAAACQALRQTGLVLVVVTNQPDIARGTQSSEQVQQINDALRRHIAIDAMYVCPHDDSDACPCRKPAPGLLVSAASDLGLDLNGSVMIGDRWRDIEAGQRAGCATVHVDRGYCERRPDGADLTVDAMPDAIGWIIQRVKESGG